LFEDDRRAWAAHAGALDGDALAVVLAGIAEEAALGIRLLHVLEVGLRDVLGAQRIAGQEAGLGIGAGLCTKVDRHAANLSLGSTRCSWTHGWTRSSTSARRSRSSASSWRTSHGAGSAGSPESS